MKKILVYSWKAYNQRDIEEAFLSAGYQIEETTKEAGNPDRDPEFESYLLEKLRQEKYVFVFSVDYYSTVARACHEAGTYYISWSCDGRILSLYNKSAFYETNRIFLFDKTDYLELLAYGLPVFYLPLGAGTERTDQVLGKPYPAEAYQTEISFVGNLYAGKNEYDKAYSSLPEYLQGYFDAALLSQIDVFGEDVLDKLMTADIIARLSTCMKLEKDRDSMADLSLIFEVTHLGFKMAHLERTGLLRELAKNHTVWLYSNEACPALPHLLAKGPVSYWEEMPLVFAQSQISLCPTMRNIRSGLPLRAWDIMAAGGFCLMNFQGELPGLFSQGEGPVFYESIQDACRKVDYFLAHPEEREERAGRTQALVRKEHSTQKRIEALLLTLRESGVEC